jgi:hypothetical protein
VNALRPSRVAASLVACLLLAAPGRAIDTALDDVPGAFLLLPYFEVDLDDPNGPQTVLSIHNESANPLLVDVTLFTDWSVQTLSFTIFLEGRAVREIELRDVFLGRYPDAEATPFCPTLGPIDPGDVAGAVAAHRGESSSLFGGQCAGQPFGDGLLRGLGLVVFPSQCSLNGGPAATQGIIGADANVLWGDYALIERAAGVAVGELLPALEALTNGIAATSGGGGPFPFSIELPPPVWGAPYSTGDGDVTEVIAMRLPLSFASSSVTCGSFPEGFPLGQMELTAYDEDGDSVSLDLFNPFPVATNRVTVGAPAVFPVPFDDGWLRIDFRNEPFVFLNGFNGAPPSFSYVAVLQRGNGSATLQRAIALPTPEISQ